MPRALAAGCRASTRTEDRARGVLPGRASPRRSTSAAASPRLTRARGTVFSADTLSLEDTVFLVAVVLVVGTVLLVGRVLRLETLLVETAPLVETALLVAPDETTERVRVGRESAWSVLGSRVDFSRSWRRKARWASPGWRQLARLSPALPLEITPAGKVSAPCVRRNALLLWDPR